MKGNIIMSNKEMVRLEILEKLKRKELKQHKAAQLLRLSVRQVKRLVKKYRLYGVTGLIHQARGKQSHRRINQKTVDEALEIVKTHYWDFGPTLAHEKLIEDHGCSLSVEKLRQEMIAVGLWKPKRRRKAHIHQLRERRACFGELFQLDGSPYDWFEGRGQSCNLNVDIDDATGIPLLAFSQSETTQSYFKLVEQHIITYGIPIAFYTDRHSIFYPTLCENAQHKKPLNLRQNEGMTQFGRAMKELGITLIPANSAQAKGRVERANQTLQDRLVKELRLQNISSIKQANQYLPKFTQTYSQRFAVVPRSTVDMHREVPLGVNISKILCITEQRVLSKNLTCQYQNCIFQIKTNRSAYTLRKTMVTIRERHDDTITIWDAKERPLEYTIIKKINHSKEVSSKELGGLVDAILIKQAHQKRNPWESSHEELESDNTFYKPMGSV